MNSRPAWLNAFECSTTPVFFFGRCIDPKTGGPSRGRRALEIGGLSGTLDSFTLEMRMNSQRILGFVLVIVGVILLVIGMNSSHSIADQVSSTFTGRFTQATTWYILGGIAIALVGLLMAIFGMRGRNV